MTNRTNDLDATTTRLIASTGNALAASRYAAETNAMTFIIPQAPRITGKVRTTTRRKRRTIR